MHKLALIVAVFSAVALLCLLAYPSPARANPARIEAPGFETLDSYWQYSETDLDFTDGTLSPAWANKTGAYSYLMSVSLVDIAKNTYCQVKQSVASFTPIDTISFDVSLYADSPDYTARMLVGAAEVWALAVPETATDYLHQEVDLSGYTGAQDLIFQIYAIGTAPNSTLTCYFDNIKIWGSYSGSGRTTVSNNFTTYGVSVYMYGENFDTSVTYKVGYYDGGTAHDGADGALLFTDSDTTLDGIFNAFVIRPADYGASSYGLWHAVVYKTTGDMPNSYNLVSKGDAAYTVTDSFTVDVECIPEFPTVFAAIGVGGLCSGIYWWMRRRAKLRAYRPPPYRQ